MPVIVIEDDSTPCCKDFSRLLKTLAGCSTGPTLSAGATGGVSSPTTGTWVNTLNATGGGTGGASGSSYVASDPTISEGWT